MTPFDIVTASLEPGVTLIEASAGTGKTYSITGLILRLVLEKRCLIRDILAVTFTEAATQELRDRIRHRLQVALEQLHRGTSDDPIIQAFLTKGDLSLGIRDLDTALQSFDEAQIFTIHGFCQRMLNDYAFESGTRFDTALVTDPKPLFEEVARDFWRGRFYQARPLLPTLAMAWEKSPDNWVEFLEQTRRHPELIVIPPIAPMSCDQLLRQVEGAFAAVKKEWTDHHAEIEEILRHHKSLARNEKAFRADRVNELLPKLAGVFADFESANPESIRGLSEVTSEAIALGTKARSIAPVHRFFALSTEFCLSVETLFNQLTHEFLAFAGLELPKRKARTNTVTYDDLITSLRDALRGKEGQALARAIRRKYSTALIDEFQDTDPAQYEIFRAIFRSKDHRLFFIGDPKQAVYGFRGADVFTYFEAAKIADRKFTLVTNWRSEEPLLAAINGLFTQAKEPFVFREIQYHAVRAPATPIVDRLTKAGAVPAALSFKLVQSQEDQGTLNQERLSDFIGESVSTDIAALHAGEVLIGKRPLRYSDMAILVRSHRQAERLQSILRKRGIRSIVQSDRNVFASEEARELQQFLRGVIDPRRDTLLKGALATTLLGFDATKLFALERDDQERQHWLDLFSSWRQQWFDGCFTAMFRNLLVTQQVRARLVHLPAGERRLTNFLHLAELLHEAESTQSLAPDAVCSWLREQRESERVSEDRFQLRLESDDDAVQITTIHKCKGLEYPIVFCPFLWLPAESSVRTELQFHDRSDPDRRLTFDLRGKKAGTEEHREWQSEEIRAEELRLLYVAVTRAMNLCYIYLPDKDIGDSPLAQLFPPSVDGSLVNEVLGFAKSSEGCVAASAAERDARRDALPRVQAQAEADFSGNDASAHATLKSRSFAGKISRIAMTASFTGLNVASTELDEEALITSDGIGTRIPPPPDDADLSIFTFDRGRRTGDFFHDVLEYMDFQDLGDLSTLIDSKLLTYGFSQTLHRPAITRILGQLMEVELEPGLKLAKIAKHERLSEVEFTYPLAHLTPAGLTNLLNSCANLAGDVRTRMGSLRFDPVEGFMRGFLDLLFRFKDRYYLIDWKSNWLGSQPADYGLEGMKRAMLEHNYYLQYHLYTLAVDLFLGRRFPGYDYQTHFGGVYYIFLRGIDPKDPSRGIFRDRPAVETVKKLGSLIS
jgi:exodeoxyribonuclease V beta subunit